jgi:hypothetical protein
MKTIFFMPMKCLEFFEALAKTGLIAIAPTTNEIISQENLLVIQLPRKDSAENAYNQMIEIINKVKLK